MTGADDLPIREMAEADLPAVTALEQSTFPCPWSRDSFRHELHHNPFARSYVVRDDREELAGYACVWMLQGELVINNINVAPEWRRRGLGRRLLRHLLEAGRLAGCLTAVL
jgi:ribosomal-protein-alanine N-acetyltransferase